jgi:hypothetical protein
MISTPVAIWTAFNALVCILAAGRDNKIGFSFVLGLSALSCGLLVSGSTIIWLGAEITYWIFQLGIALLALAVSPPNHDNSDVSSIAMSASIRLIIAMIVWLCL